MSGSHYVYLYRTPSGKPKYVGYGHDVDRAISHARDSHNSALRGWLEAGNFDLTVAGPYRDEKEGLCVEAALISGLSPEYNRSRGNGPRFVPLGVPPLLSDRPGMAPLTLGDVGTKAKGALLVYLSPGDFLADGRPKFSPATPDDQIILHDMEQMWQIGGLIDQWKKTPVSAPKILVGAYGPIGHRFIVGAARIDTEGWGDPNLHVAGDRWRVPIMPGSSLDAGDLRGRRVAEVRFGRLAHLLHIWVDAQGSVLHPKS